MVIIALHEMFVKLKFKRVEMNFLVTGHSQNENDNAHSQIEQKTKLRTLYTPDEWAAGIKMSFKPDKVVVSRLQSDEVIDFKDKNSFPEYTALLNDSATENDESFANKKDGKIFWSKIMQYHFVKSDPDKLFFKYTYSAPDYKYTTIYKKITTRTAVKKREKLYPEPQGIDQSKKTALLKLCHENLIPPAYWKFFEDLKVKVVQKKKKANARKKNDDPAHQSNSDSETNSEDEI